MHGTHPDEGTLRAHLDGELPWRARAACATHLRRCAGCRDRLAELTALDARATRLLAHARPAAPVRPLQPRRPRRSAAARVVAAAAASAAAVAMAALWFRAPSAGAELASRDVCCWDLDGGGRGDDGVFTVSRRGQVVECVVLYDDVDGSGSYTRRDVVRSSRAAAACSPHRAVPPVPVPAS